MAKIYLVMNKRTREVLNAKGGWSDSVKSYRLAEFETVEAATAAFPVGIECEIHALKKEGDPR